MGRFSKGILQRRADEAAKQRARYAAARAAAGKAPRTLYLYQDEMLPLKEVARRAVVSYQVLQYRIIRKGMSLDAAIAKPVQQRNADVKALKASNVAVIDEPKNIGPAKPNKDHPWRIVGIGSVRFCLANVSRG